MKVVSWNVNSIRAREARVLALLDRHEPDVLCLQETKVADDDFPMAAFADRGYHVALRGQPTYNGVAIASRLPLTDIVLGFPGDPIPYESRAISAVAGGIRVVDLYVVNGQAPDSPKFATKRHWLGAVKRWLTETATPDDPLLLVGDFNIAPSDADVHDPEKWHGQIHCTPEERGWLADLMGWGLTDLHRARSDEPGFTWWDYRYGAFARGWGLRIDLALATGPVAARCTSVTVDRDERKKGDGEEKPSDHAPLIVELDDA